MIDFLLEEGYKVEPRRVRRMMRLMGIMPVSHRKSLSKLGTTCYIKPYLLRGLDINRRNQVWCIDITYIPMQKVFMYLTAIIDVYKIPIKIRITFLTCITVGMIMKHTNHLIGILYWNNF